MSDSSPLAALVNDDYECVLFRDEIGEAPYQAMQAERVNCDYMFFFVNEAEHLSLKSSEPFDEAYLEYLQMLGVVVPKISQHGASFNWYGRLSDIPKERQLNSKLWGYKFLEDLGLKPPTSHVVRTATEARQVIESGDGHKWLMKNPFLMGGEGFTQLDSAGAVPPFATPQILEPYHERLLDLAAVYRPEADVTSFHLCRSTPAGKYQGGTLFESEAGLGTHAKSLGLLSEYEELRAKMTTVIAGLKKFTPQQPVSIDGFIYRSTQGAYVHPCCDINYRRSYGVLLQSLRRFLPTGGVGELYVLKPSARYTHYETFAYDRRSRRGLICLTPKNSKVMTLFFCGDNYQQVQRLVRLFFSDLSVRG